MRVRTWVAVVVVSAAAWLEAGCEGAAGPGWGGTVDTLAGGGIRVRNPARGTWTSATRWKLVPDLRIGSLEGEGPELFGSVTDVEVDGYGRLWVLERQAGELRVFDSDGTYVRTVGRQGGGPGEFRAPMDLAWGPHGNLWVNDLQNRRYEVFDTSGRRLAGLPMQGTGFDLHIVFDGAGRVIDRELRPGRGAAPVMVVRDPADGLRAVDSVPVPEQPDPETVEFSVPNQDGSTRRMAMPMPLVHQPAAILLPGGSWLLWPGGSDYRFLRVGLRGDTSLVVERAYEPVPIPEEERRAAIRRSSPLGVDVDIPDERVPRVHAPFDRVYVASDGYFWVRRTVGSGSQGFDLFDPEGRYLGQVETDVYLDRLTPYTFHSDAVYGVLRDELDVPWVVRLKVVRGG